MLVFPLRDISNHDNTTTATTTTTTTTTTSTTTTTTTTTTTITTHNNNNNNNNNNNKKINITLPKVMVVMGKHRSQISHSLRGNVPACNDDAKNYPDSCTSGYCCYDMDIDTFFI